jgi:phage-related protein
MGVVVNSYPPIVHPKERTTEITVPGRPGTLTLTEGENVYDPFIRSMPCSVRTQANANALIAWLRGAGTVIFGDEPAFSYRARVDAQFDLARIMKGREPRSFTIPFVCQPFRYLYPPVSPIEITSTATTVTNPGNASSLPLIKVEGSGDITLYVGSQAVDLTGISCGIFLDCEMQDAYDLGVTGLLNSAMSGAFPSLDPGLNVVSWTGTVTKVTITPRWRWE